MNIFFRIVIFSFVSAVFAESTFAQKNQEFSVSDFKEKKAVNQREQSSIGFSFDLIMHHPVEDYIQHPYRLHYCLLQNGDTVFYDKLYKRLYADADYSDKTIASERALKLKIPLAEIELPAGEHEVLLAIWASYKDSSYAVFYEQPLSIVKPQMFSYKEQEFEISDFNAEAGKNKGVGGISVQFKTAYKFTTEQIKETAYSSEYAYYLFKLSVSDAETGMPVKFFETEHLRKKAAPDKLNADFDFFIPDYSVNLPEGNHRFLIELKITDYAGKQIFRNRDKAALSYRMPQICIAYVDVQGMQAYKKKYDASSLLGRMFSNPKKNKGKGWPESYWALKNAAVWRYEAPYNKNSFTVIPGSTQIIVSKEDPLALCAYDYDAIGFDEIIGSYALPVKNTAGKISKRNIRFGGIKSASFDFSCTAFPRIKSGNMESKICKHKGQSGLCISGSYRLSSLPETEKLRLLPAAYSHNRPTYLSQIKNADIENKNISDRFSFFVPFTELQKAEQIACELRMQNFNAEIGTIFSEKKFSMPKFDDTECIIAESNENQYSPGGLSGTKICLRHEIPDAYKKENDIRAKISIRSRSNPDFALDTVLIPEYDGCQKLHIPYSLLPEGASKQALTIESKVLAGKLQIGDTKIETVARRPDLEQISINKLKIKSRDFVNDSICAVLYHGGRAFTSRCDFVGKKASFAFAEQRVSTAPNDYMHLILIQKDKYGVHEKIGEYKFKAKNLNSGKLKIRRPFKKFKKLIIRASHK